MPATQTSYTENMPIGQVGQVVNMELANSITKVVEDAAGIGFGLAVFQGVNDKGITAAQAGGAAMFIGVTIADRTIVRGAPTQAQTTTPVDTYPQYANAGIHDKGVIWVNTIAAVTMHAPVYLTPAGAWTSASAGNMAIPNAFFDSSNAAPGLAKLRIR